MNAIGCAETYVCVLIKAVRSDVIESLYETILFPGTKTHFLKQNHLTKNILFIRDENSFSQTKSLYQHVPRTIAFTKTYLIKQNHLTKKGHCSKLIFSSKAHFYRTTYSSSATKLTFSTKSPTLIKLYHLYQKYTVHPAQNSLSQAKSLYRKHTAHPPQKVTFTKKHTVHLIILPKKPYCSSGTNRHRCSRR